jgi:hypothetical protein
MTHGFSVTTTQYLGIDRVGQPTLQIAAFAGRRFCLDNKPRVTCERGFLYVPEATALKPNRILSETEDTVTIELTKGKSTTVNKSTLGLAQTIKWHASKDKNGKYYARCSAKSSPTKCAILLHRHITNAPSNMVVDHINGDTLDNRLSNLRICTMAENLRNATVSKRNKSGYKGVSWDKKSNKWRADIHYDGKLHSLGRYTNVINAAIAYDQAARKHFGDFACLNFPESNEQAA